MEAPYSTFAQNTLKGEFNHFQNFQNQQIMPPEKFSEGKDIENWLLKLTTYLLANPHLNKELTLKCLLDDSILALVELASTKANNFEDLCKILQRLFKEKSIDSKSRAT